MVLFIRMMRLSCLGSFLMNQERKIVFNI